MVGVIHSPPPKPPPTTSAKTSSASATDQSLLSSSCSYECNLPDSDNMVLCSSDCCSNWCHFECTQFPNMDFLSSSAKNKMLFKCPPCYFKPLLSSSSISPDCAANSDPVLSSDSPSSIASSSSPPPNDENSSSSLSANSVPALPSDRSCSIDSSNVEASTSNLNVNQSSTETDPKSISPSVSPSSVSSSSGQVIPRHRRHSLRLQPTTTSLVLSDSQLRHVSKYGLDGSGSTQIYSLSGALISDLTKALHDLSICSPSSIRNKVTDVFVLIGGNDLVSASSSSLQLIQNDFDKLIGTLNLVLPEAEQHYLPFLPRPDTSPDLISSSNSMLKTSYGPHFTEIPTITATSTFFKSDRVHLNFKGISTVCSVISNILNVKGSLDSPLLLPRRHSNTALLPTPPLLPSPPLLPKPSPSTPCTSVQTASLHRQPVFNSSSAMHSSYAAAVKTPSNQLPGLLPFPEQQLTSHTSSTSSHPLTPNTSVHPPGTGNKSLINHLTQAVLQNIITGLQSQIPQIISHYLDNQQY